MAGVAAGVAGVAAGEAAEVAEEAGEAYAALADACITTLAPVAVAEPPVPYDACLGCGVAFLLRPFFPPFADTGARGDCAWSGCSSPRPVAGTAPMSPWAREVWAALVIHAGRLSGREIRTGSATGAISATLAPSFSAHAALTARSAARC